MYVHGCFLPSFVTNGLAMSECDTDPITEKKKTTFVELLKTSLLFAFYHTQANQGDVEQVASRTLPQFFPSSFKFLMGQKAEGPYASSPAREGRQ